MTYFHIKTILVFRRALIYSISLMFLLLSFTAYMTKRHSICYVSLQLLWSQQKLHLDSFFCFYCSCKKLTWVTKLCTFLPSPKADKVKSFIALLTKHVPGICERTFPLWEFVEDVSLLPFSTENFRMVQMTVSFALWKRDYMWLATIKVHMWEIIILCINARRQLVFFFKEWKSYILAVNF